MRKGRSLTSAGTSFAIGSIFSGVTYATLAQLLGGTGIVPVAGAIAVAGLAPLLLSARIFPARPSSVQFETAQRLVALDQHAMVNIVDKNNILTEVNQQFLDLTGYAREDVIGKPVAVLYDDNSKSLALDIRGHLARGETWQGETPLRHADGSMFYTQATIMPLYDEQGNWSGSISARTDVTHTNELVAQRDTAQTLHELRDDIWIVDARSEQLVYMNKAAKSRFGWRPEDIAGKFAKDIGEAAEGSMILEACRNLIEKGESFSSFEMTYLGLPFQISVKYLADRNRSGRFLVLLCDISEQVEQERRKSEFISTVSHELRSPLTAIKGSMGLLLSNAVGELPSKAHELLEIAHRNADRLVLIINDILDLEKISSGNMDFDSQAVDICALVRESNAANALIQNRFSLDVQTTGIGTPIILHTDPDRIIQVLNNFLSNACKFSKPSGRIEIAVADTDDHVRVSVKDEGAGIPIEDQQKVFARFADMANSDRSKKGGTGLGLSICKAIIDGLGGTIGFDTQEGIGTTFYFVLPKNAEETRAAPSGDGLAQVS
ncbi:PAS domain S-box protein [Sulfitobacter sp. TSTF-M16]|uniref:histidine kinase n=1 Tax=Sulfitobacter aestuariivivens TaxID=2766981 RepID=A0A927D056_9RHOB|nr:PAS domain S-box protein [Sulfitobacter aestuariivivens]